jgi:hypothetical protein
LSYAQYAATAARQTLNGTYRVDGFPIWQQVVMENMAFSPTMRVTLADGAVSTYSLEVDAKASRLQLGDPREPAGSLAFGTAGQDLTLDGELHGAPARMRLIRSTEEFILLQRGFHWVTELPFHR